MHAIPLASLTQWLECQSCKLEVVSSNLTRGSVLGKVIIPNFLDRTGYKVPFYLLTPMV